MDKRFLAVVLLGIVAIGGSVYAMSKTQHSLEVATSSESIPSSSKEIINTVSNQTSTNSNTEPKPTRISAESIKVGDRLGKFTVQNVTQAGPNDFGGPPLIDADNIEIVFVGSVAISGTLKSDEGNLYIENISNEDLSLLPNQGYDLYTGLAISNPDTVSNSLIDKQVKVVIGQYVFRSYASGGALTTIAISSIEPQ